jgi:hypothetical protein
MKCPDCKDTGVVSLFVEYPVLENKRFCACATGLERFCKVILVMAEHKESKEGVARFLLSRLAAGEGQHRVRRLGMGKPVSSLSFFL